MMNGGAACVCGDLSFLIPHALLTAQREVETVGKMLNWGPEALSVVENQDDRKVACLPNARDVNSAKS